MTLEDGGRRRSIVRSITNFLVILAVGIASACARRAALSRPPPKADLGDPLFVIRALGNRCVDVGPPERAIEQTPVVIRACRDAAAQRFRLQEIAEAPLSHDFLLMIPGTPLCIGVSGLAVSAGNALEAQTCTGSSRQRFAFDGDALLVGVQKNGVRVSRDFAIEPRDANTNEGTPLVAGTREFSDAEYWRMIAADGSDARPTSGFVRVTDYHELDLALQRGWGTVIELAPPDDRLLLERLWALPDAIDPDGNNIVRAGVTLRGGRKFLFNGVEISAPASLFVETHNYALGVENQARITGLRLRGPGPLRPQEGGVASEGVLIQNNGGEAFTNVIVDHVEASGWSEVGFHVSGTRPLGTDDPINPALCVERFHDKPIAKLVGNFLHHNIYSIAVDSGGYAFTARNLFYRSRHDLTADGNAANRYIARDSLFTSESAGNEHMVDVHGRCSSEGSHWRGGRAGDAFDIGWNTFINRDRGLLLLRGTPCHEMSFHDNVTIRDESSLQLALQPTSGPPCESAPGVPFVPGDPATVLVTANNTFNYPDPTRTSEVGDFGVGDFDGDGVDDVFLGTGATWWFSSGGKAEWRFLNRMPERASALRFGDFDGDGRTDIVRVHGRVVEVSWAGGSRWQRLSLLPVSTATIADIAVGQFDADPRADLFLADGTQWRWASAGAAWDFFAFSGFRTRNLRFGDFTHDGRTDVFGIESGKWRIVRGPGGHWQDLGPARSNDIDTLVVADFDGDGIADVGQHSLSVSPQSVRSRWLISKSGTHSFRLLRNAPLPQFLTALPIGRFDEGAGADVLYWDSLHFRIASGGKTEGRWSRQSMR